VAAYPCGGEGPSAQLAAAGTVQAVERTGEADGGTGERPVGLRHGWWARERATTHTDEAEPADDELRQPLDGGRPTRGEGDEPLDGGRPTRGEGDAVPDRPAAPNDRRPHPAPRRSSRWLHPAVDPRLAGSAVLGVAGGLLLAQAAAAVFAQLRNLIAIVVISLFLSFAMEPAVQWLARRGIRRGAGTGLVFVTVVVVLTGFVAAMLPMMVDQVSNLVASAPRLLREISELAERLPGEAGQELAAWLDETRRNLPARTNEVAGIIGRSAVGVGQSLLGGAFRLATIGLVTFYLVADAPKLRRTLASRLEPREQVRILGLWELAVAKTGGYVYSRALTAIVSSLFHITAFVLLDLEYAIALGVWVGLVSSLIPAIGTYLAGALPLIVALADSPAKALWVLVAIVVYQQIENYVIVPKITASTLELHPAVAFLAVLGGAALAGATGALLAIPAVAIVAALISASSEEYEVLEHSLLETGEAGAKDLVEDAHGNPATPLT
jgi:predicted PurR-regulated permease PerM